MPYLGRPVTNAGQFEIIDDISSSFNGSTTSFTLQVNGTNIQPDVSNVIITLDGVTQIPASAYSITGSTINFTEAPPSSTSFNGILAGQSQFIESDFITNTHIKSTANISGSKINTDFSGKTVSANSGSFNYITASVIDTDASTIRVGGTPINKTLVDNLTTMTGSGTVQGTGTTDSPTFAGGTYTSNLGVSGSVTVKGTLTAQEFKTEFVSASITFTSGSTKFGDTSDDVHNMTGSLRITGSGDHYIQTGNVGIGTNNPGRKLDIVSQGDAVALNIRTRTADDYGFITFSDHDSSDSLFLGQIAVRKSSASSGSINFYTSGENLRMAISSSGEIGIGTESALASLHINRDVTQVSSSAESKTQAGFYLNSNPTYGSNSLTMFEMSSSVATAGTYGIQISNSNGTSKYPLALQPYGGNIGIGTGSPQSQVEISNTGEASLAVIGTRGVGGGDATLYLVENTKAYGIRMRYDGGDDRLYINADEDTRNIMTLNRSDGKVGIGTTSPAYPLDIVSTINNGAALAIRGDVDADGRFSGIQFGDNGTTSYSKGGIFYEGKDAYARGNLHFALEGGTGADNADLSDARMTITYGGNVGIGTDSPGERLHIYNSDHNWVFFDAANGKSAGAKYAASAGSAGFFVGDYSGNKGNFSFYDANLSGGAGVSVIIQSGSGNVGIGDSSPSAPLEVGSTGMGSMGYTGTLIAAASASATEYAQGSSNTWGPSVAVSNTDTSSTRTGAAMKFVHRGSSSGVAAIVSTSAAADRGDLRFITRGAGNVIDEKVQITEDGYLLSHKLPAFHAYGFAAHVYANSADRDPLKYNSTHYNQGSHYSTSTGKFTAPINGIYFFAMSAMYRHVGGDFHVGIKVNNTSKTISNDHQEYQASGFAGDGDLHTWVQTQSTLVASLAANDYVTCYMGSSTNSGTYLYNSSNYNHFCGFLVG